MTSDDYWVTVGFTLGVIGASVVGILCVAISPFMLLLCLIRDLMPANKEQDNG